MASLTLLVVSIAVADSINPSTVMPALWMASTSRSHLPSFTLGVFALYLAGGLALVFGPGPALISAMHHVGPTLEASVQAAAGVAVLALAVGLWRSRRSPGTARLPRSGCGRSAAFTLGAGIMAVELPTAFMYFGAITAILASHATVPFEVSLLVTYNAVFVAPLVAILVIRRRASGRAGRWLAAGWDRLLGFGQVLLAGLTGSVGAVLLIIGVTGLLTGTR
ncbi:MAG: GAP family protein [Solirubrobacteraceae bacterium]